MLYRPPSHEMPPMPQNKLRKLDSDKGIKKDELTILGYTHACVGATLSLIKKGNAADETLFGQQDTIISELNGYTLWSASVIGEANGLNRRAITLVYHLEEGYDSDAENISWAWMTAPEPGKKQACLMMLLDNGGIPSVHRYTKRKGWHHPSVRQIKKSFHFEILPIDKSESIRPRAELLRQYDHEYFRQTMREFEAYQS